MGCDKNAETEKRKAENLNFLTKSFKNISDDQFYIYLDGSYCPLSESKDCSILFVNLSKNRGLK